MAKEILSWIQQANSGKNLEEYQTAKTDDDLAEIVRKDAKRKGLLEIKQDKLPKEDNSE